MKRYSYPDLTSHKAEHNRFKEKEAPFIDHFQSERTAIAVEVSDALQDADATHLKIRRAYARFFLSNGIADIEIDLLASRQQLDCPAQEASS